MSPLDLPITPLSWIDVAAALALFAAALVVLCRLYRELDAAPVAAPAWRARSAVRIVAAPRPFDWLLDAPEFAEG